jgi:hypothetical protein
MNPSSPPAAVHARRVTLPRSAGWVPASRIAGWLVGVFRICFVYFLPRSDDWNAQARLDMSLAIVNHGTIAIDAYHWNSLDEAYYHGHYFSNKAPGQSLVGVPVYAAHKALLRLVGNTSFDDVGLPTASGRVNQYYILVEYLESMYTVAIPAVFLLLLFFWFLGFYSTSLVNRTILTLALGLGTVISPYAQLFYSHVPTAALLFAGFVLIHLLCRREARDSAWAGWLLAHPTATALLAGFALGAAVLFEYPACLIGALIGIYAVARLPRRLLPYVVAGAVPPLLGLLSYNYAAYHNPLTTGYGDSAVAFWRTLHANGGTASTWSFRPKAIIGLSLSLYRGLFFLSPWLLLAFPGYLLWARRGGRDWLLFLAIPIVFFAESSMYSGWDGGATVGSRYLIPMLPFLALPVIFVLDRVSSSIARFAIYAAIAIAIAAVWIETLGGTSVYYPLPGIDNPLFTYSLPGLAHGDLPNNLGRVVLSPLFGDNAMVTLLPFFGLLAGLSLAVWGPLLVARHGRLGRLALARILHAPGWPPTGS